MESDLAPERNTSPVSAMANFVPGPRLMFKSAFFIVRQTATAVVINNGLCVNDEHPSYNAVLYRKALFVAGSARSSPASVKRNS